MIETALNCHAKICWLFSIYHHRQLLFHIHISLTRRTTANDRGRKRIRRIGKTKFSIKPSEKERRGRNKIYYIWELTSLYVSLIRLCILQAKFTCKNREKKSAKIRIVYLVLICVEIMTPESHIIAYWMHSQYIINRWGKNRPE